MARSGKSKARTKKPETMTRTRQLPHQLTMQQEARNTEGRNIWLPSSQLRHKTVQFVRAGNLEPEETKVDTVSEFDKEALESTTQTEMDIDKADNTDGNEDAPNEGDFFIDLSSQSITHTGLPDPVSGLHSFSSEDSSGDEIVFHGRNRRTNPTTYSQHQPRIEDDFLYDSCDAKNGNENTGYNEKPHTLATAMMSKGRNTETSEREGYKDHAISLQDRREFVKKGNRRGLLEDQDDLLADYIANIDVDYEETDISCSMESKSGGGIGSSNPNPCGPSPDPDDPAGVVSMNGALKNHEFTSSSGKISRDREIDDHEIAAFGDEKHGTKNIVQEDALDTLYLQNRDSASSSGNDDLKQFDFSDSEIQSDGDFSSEEIALELAESPRREPSRQKTINSNRTKFPSASRFADALESDPYYGFDIMDFNRPSLRKKAKGKKGPPDLMLSDSELEQELEQAWRNDRDKKKFRKQKREELRSRGLLGRGMQKPDLKTKYANGMGVEDLKLETRLFLLSSKDSLPLPPISKHLRKLVHDIANALSLKSHSQGKGSFRFPILYKTSRTPSYSEQNISEADRILSRGRFRHRTVKPWDQNEKSTKSRRGRPDTSASYMDGDVVGASAPEIGMENRGRAMLEKMGWSSGTALGATNNKGILLPVAHVVKKSKAGLG